MTVPGTPIPDHIPKELRYNDIKGNVFENFKVNK
jgi:hypothetical protein